MTPTTYGRDFAYCLKSHGGVRGFNASLWRFLLRCTLFCHSVATFLTSVSSYEGGCGFEVKMNLEGIDYNCARREHNPWEIIIAYLCMYKDLFGLLKYYDGKQHFLKGHDELLKNKCIGIDLPSGACMLMKKDVLKNIGGFDPNTFLFYEEDILYKKLSKLKLNSYLVPECKCIHLGACSTSKTTNYFSLSAQFKSSLYYLHNYVDLSVIQRVCLLLGSMMFRVKLWAIKMQKS